MSSFWNLTQCCMPTCKFQSKTKKKLKYIPPPRTQPCLPRPSHFGIPDEKMEDRTVYRMSYSSSNTINKGSACVGTRSSSTNNMPCQGPMCQPQCPICPLSLGQRPLWCCSDQGVQRSCYQECYCQPKEDEMPWKRKPKYVPPKLKMDDQTVQKLSYAPPGEFVEYTDDESDCCYYPYMPPCEGPNMFHNPQCCQYCVWQGY